MSDELIRLLNTPTIRHHLAVADSGLALITVTHEHEDKVTIERHRLGPSIAIDELLAMVGVRDIAAPAIAVSTPPLAGLPALPDEQAPADPDAPAVCQECGRTFKNQQGLKTHTGRMHLRAARVEVTKITPAEQAPQPPEPASTMPPRFVCSQCGRTFKSQDGYALHVEIAHVQGIAPAPKVTEGTCSTCGGSLDRHLRCCDCAGLLGPGHDAGEAASGSSTRPLCSVCVKYHQTVEALGIAA